MTVHKTSAWPLTLVCMGLIVYASLYPFEGWRDQGVAPWFFLFAPWPRYWTGFDLLANVLGYMPLGFFLALSALRTGRGRHVLGSAILVSAGLSLSMETLQVFLPGRVPSNLDLALNVIGGALGAATAWSLEKTGLLQRWSRFRAHWFVPDARGALVLLALWPVALWYPSAVPFGLGQVLERLVMLVARLLADSTLFDGVTWPILAFQPASAGAAWLVVLLGWWAPCLIGYCIIASKIKRVWLLLWVLVWGFASTALSAALSFGPEFAWSWLTWPVSSAVLAALVLSIGLLWLPPRASAVLALLAQGVGLSLINQMSVDSYFEQTLFLWEQGRFIRFHGLAQWLGWLWPFAALVYVASLLWQHKPEN